MESEVEREWERGRLFTGHHPETNFICVLVHECVCVCVCVREEWMYAHE